MVEDVPPRLLKLLESLKLRLWSHSEKFLILVESIIKFSIVSLNMSPTVIFLRHDRQPVYPSKGR